MTTTPRCTFHSDREASAELDQGPIKIDVCMACWLIKYPHTMPLKLDLTELYQMFRRGAIDQAEYDELAARIIRQERGRS